MIDREKVIHAVETAFELWIDEYTGCSWFKEDEVRQAKEDAIALLKEQEAVEPVPPEDEFGLYLCGKCYHPLFRCVDRYCSRCGKEVKWE